MKNSEIFKRAWALARIASKRFSEAKTFKFGKFITQNAGVNAKASEFFAECLKIAWAESKRAVKQFVEVISDSSSWISVPATNEHLAVVKMMQLGDNASAYDSIEMGA